MSLGVKRGRCSVGEQEEDLLRPHYMQLKYFDGYAKGYT